MQDWLFLFGYCICFAKAERRGIRRKKRESTQSITASSPWLFLGCSFAVTVFASPKAGTVIEEIKKPDYLIFKKHLFVMPAKKIFSKQHHTEEKENDVMELISYGLFSLFAFVGTFFLLFKKKPSGPPLSPAQKIDIEIRYETEKDADATLLAQNIVKVIRMVLMPLESEIKKEDAKLIFVYGGEFWEMRLRNSSERLKSSVRKRLESQEW